MRKAIIKIALVILTVCLLVGSFGCRDKVSYNPTLPTNKVDDYKVYLNEVFSSTQDLSDAQGYRNWYYYCGDAEIDMLDYMVFSEYYGRWCSKYHHLYTETYMWGDYWLPDARQSFGVGMSFKAPAPGTLDIVVTLNLIAPPELSSGDGVVFTISDIKGNAYEILSLEKEDGGKDVVIETSVQAKIDEEVLFMLFANTNNTNDFTKVDITITYSA